MTRSATRGTPGQSTRGRPEPPAVDRLSNRHVDADTGLHIGNVEVDGRLLRVGIRPRSAAGPATGPPLMIFNGIGANLELAGPMMSRLDQFETLIFDVPGAGKSPPPKAPYRLFWLASLAGKLLDHLGYGTVDVLGVSWGGGLAQQFTLQYSARVRRLVLAATTMGGPTMLPGNLRVLLKMVNPRRFLDKGYMTRIAPDLYGGALRDRPEAIKHFTDHASGGNSVGYRYQLLAMLGWTSLPWLWCMRQPTLVLAGDDDPLVPLINARILATLLPDARLHVLHDGHLFMLTSAQETADIIATFLGETRAGGSA